MHSAIKTRLNTEYLKPYLQIEIDQLNIQGDQQACASLLQDWFDELLIPISEYKAVAQKNGTDPRVLNMPNNRFILIKRILSECETQVTLKGAKSLLERLDSFNRMEILIDLYHCMQKDDWTLLLLDKWSACDGCSLYHEELMEIMSLMDLDYIKTHLYCEKLKAQEAALPECFDIYRGGFDINEPVLGAAWTTQQHIAERFFDMGTSLLQREAAFYRVITSLSRDAMTRFHYYESQVINLYKAKVHKSNVLMVRQREEGELICFNVESDCAEIIKTFIKK